MQNENPQRPVSPLLKRLQIPEQNSIRKGLRIAGPVVFSIGLVCAIICVASLFASLGTYDHPRYFGLGFVGLPLMFVGSVLSMYGYMGAVTRFVADESAPVAADTVNYMAEETKGAVETVAKAAAKGVVEGIEAGRFKPEPGKD
jgi:hypothetical protein